MMTRSAIYFLLAGTAVAQSFQTEVLHGRQAYVLENGIIRVSALRGGGHIAEIRFLNGDARRTLNPMRVPHYPTTEPYQYDPARHDAIYGDGSHRFLSSGYMGHLLCFPSFGPPSSDDEVKNLLGNHGEAPIAEWKQDKVEQDAGHVTLWYSAHLPRTQYRVERALTLRQGASALDVQEWVENLASYDRPINWVQHATFGPPFIEPGKTYYDVSGVKGEVTPGAGNSLRPGPIQFPRGAAADGRPADLRLMQPAPGTGTYYYVRSDPAREHAWFTMYHREYPVLIGYVFPAADNPWIADWQENKRNAFKPWDRQVIARGIEFGSTPIAEGLRKTVERAAIDGTPTYRWINGRQKLKTTWTVFLAEIPAGFPGTNEIALSGAALTLSPRGGGRPIRVALSSGR
jgi:hypothetical protein